MSSGDLTAYMDAVRTLWPEGPEPRLVRRGASSPDRPGWLVVPDAERPRMLVPADGPAAAASAMMRFSSSLGAGERAKRIGAGIALGASRGAFVANRLEAGSAEGSLLADLSRSAGEELVCTLTLGTARVNRKPVLQLLTRHGRGVAFAKVGLTDRTQADVRTEHQNLCTLEEAGVPEFLHVPRVLSFQEWRGLPVLVMSQLRTPALERRLVRPAEVFDAMDVFSRHFAAGTLPLPEVPLWKSLRDAMHEIIDDATRTELLSSMERLAEGAASVPVGAWHGDWAPWNMARTRTGIQLWDWERFETGVPVGFDRCHFAVNTALVRWGLSAASLDQGIANAGYAGARPGSAGHAVVGLYLVAILHRYLHGSAEPPPMVLQRVDVLADGLRRWLGRR